MASARRGWDLDSYRSPNHPIHRRVLRAVTASTDVERPRIGVDGCGIPVHGVPLRAMATMFARLGSPERLGRLASAADRIVRGMLAAPHMVGGTRRLDTDVMTAGDGQVIAKEGAEGLVCATSLPQGIGIALKVTDGNWRRLAPAVIKVLRDLDVFPEPDRRRAPAPRAAPRPGRRGATGRGRGRRSAPERPLSEVARSRSYDGGMKRDPIGGCTCP